jgi:hypothetical protein
MGRSGKHVRSNHAAGRENSDDVICLRWSLPAQRRLNFGPVAREGHFFFRNGVFPASASIDAHGRFIKEFQELYKKQTSKRGEAASHRPAMILLQAI